MDAPFQPLDVAALSADGPWGARADWWTWGFVALGAMIRLIGYGLRFPLWVDECMLCENFLDRGFFDLLAPLDNHQIAPIGFLWIELASVKVFGFSEWSLRLFPLVCGIAGLVVFRHLAARLLSGAPLVLAVGCLAVAKGPQGLSANVKPYSCDLLMALVLLALAVEWLRWPERTRWLWALAAVVPLALALSYPALFVAGGISAGLLVKLFRLPSARAWAAHFSFNVLLVATFAALLAIHGAHQTRETRDFMIEYWTAHGGFPPGGLVSLGTWLLDTHLGDNIFAVPYGAENGGGSIALVCSAVGAAAMWRRGQRPVVTMFLATIGLALVASAMRRYPYGGHHRLVQFLVPAIALMAGLGAAVLLERVPRARLRRLLADGLVMGLVLFGVGLCARDVWHPWHYIYDEHHRQFARRFWQDEPNTITICALTDLGHELYPRGWYAYYRCNQHIYSPPHHAGRRLEASALDDIKQPVRLVVYHPPRQTASEAALKKCLRPFERRFATAGHEVHHSPQPNSADDVYGRYEVFQFAPRETLVRAD